MYDCSIVSERPSLSNSPVGCGKAMCDPSSSTELLRRGVSLHLVSDLTAAMGFYERSLQLRLGEASAQAASIQEPSPCRQQEAPSPLLVVEPPRLADEDAEEGDPGLIGMGRYVDPQLPPDDDEDEGHRSVGAILLFNIALIKMSRGHFEIAKELLDLAAADMDAGADEDDHQGSNSSRRRRTFSWLRLRLMISTNLGHALYRLGLFDEAAVRFDEASALPGLILQQQQHQQQQGSASGREEDASPCPHAPLLLLHERDPSVPRSFLRTIILTLLNVSRARNASSYSADWSGPRPDQALALAREAGGLCETLALTCLVEGDDDEQQSNKLTQREDEVLHSVATYVEATARHRRNELKQAEELYRKCLEQVKEQQQQQEAGQRSSSSGISTSLTTLTSAALHGRGRALFQLRRVEESIDPLRLAWSLRSRALGETDPGAVEALYSLGRALHDADHIEDALCAYEMVRGLQVRSLGGGHPDSLRTLCNVARVRRACGMGRGALEACEEAAREGSASLGDNHQFVVDMLVMKGAVLREMGRMEEASEAVCEAIRRTRNTTDAAGGGNCDARIVRRAEDVLSEYVDCLCLVGMDPAAGAA